MIEIESIIALKYPPITAKLENVYSWHSLEEYPAEVIVSWVLKCLKELDYLVVGDSEFEYCINLVKLYLEGKSTRTEIYEAHSKCWEIYDKKLHCEAAYSVANTYATYATDLSKEYNVWHAVNNVCILISGEPEKNWKKYCGWLKEELVKYEEDINKTPF